MVLRQVYLLVSAKDRSTSNRELLLLNPPARCMARDQLGNGENIKLNAETSDKLKQNMADSSVKINCGSLANYNSEAQALKETGIY